METAVTQKHPDLIASQEHLMDSILNNSHEFIKFSSRLNAEEALTKGNQISKLKQLYEAKLAEVIATLIRRLCDSFNVSENKNMKQDQILETTILLVENYWWLRLEELIYIFKQAKLGKYGKVYDRIDGPTIFEWIRKYDEERNVLQERRRLMIKKEYNVEENGALILEKLKEDKPEKFDRKDIFAKKDKQDSDDSAYSQFKAQYFGNIIRKKNKFNKKNSSHFTSKGLFKSKIVSRKFTSAKKDIKS